MKLSKQTIAIAITGLASVTWMGVSAALESDDPVLTDPVVAPADEATDDDAAEDEATEDEVVDQVVEPAADDPAEEPAVETEDAAVEHPENHGASVSEAARETCPTGPEHGPCVAEEARSDSGKPGAGVTGTEDDSDVDASDDAELEGSGADDQQVAGGRGSSAGRGNGHGKG
jgi:hypothetical protein